MNEDVRKFYELMSEDEGLQAKSEELLKEIDKKNLSEDERNDAYDNGILALARENGFHFTLEDVSNLNEEIMGGYGELDVDSLDQVAGGGIFGGMVLTYGVMPNPGSWKSPWKR